MSRHRRIKQQMERLNQAVTANHENKTKTGGSRVSLNVIDLSKNMLSGNMPDRACGDCSECCTAMGVKSLGKPHGCSCHHLKPDGHGCGIYAERPEECKEWLCLWKMGWGNESDRPDKSGVLLSLNRPMRNDMGKEASIDIIELRSGALRQRFKTTGGGPPEFFNLLPADHPERFEFNVMFVGVPRKFAAAVSEGHADHPNAKWTGDGCRDKAVGNGMVNVLLGVIDAEGNLHNGSNVIPARSVQEMDEVVIPRINKGMGCG